MEQIDSLTVMFSSLKFYDSLMESVTKSSDEIIFVWVFWFA